MDMNKVNANCVTYEQTFLSMIQQIETNFQLRDIQYFQILEFVLVIGYVLGKICFNILKHLITLLKTKIN